MKKVLIVGLMAASMFSCQNEKTAYVNTEKILEEYQEMKDAQEDYQTQSSQMQMSMQQQVQSYQEEVQSYQENVNSMSTSEREEVEQELMNRRQQLQQMQQMSGMQLQQQSQAHMDSVINRIKDYVKEYGEENGYDYIYSQGEQGGVMYAKESYEITDEILKNLNEAYSGKTANEEVEEEEVDSISAE